MNNIKLNYEIEYLNGENSKGYGKIYDENGILRYDGEFLDGKKYGKGKLYDKQGNLIN